MLNRLKPLYAVYALIFTAFSAAAATPPSPVSDPAASPDSPAISTAPASVQPVTYTSVKGDSFSSVSERFHTTVHALKKLNGIKVTHLKPGTVLQLPKSRKSLHAPSQSAVADAKKKPLTPEDTRKTALAEALAATKKMHHHPPVAQPVQDFDISPSVFASCPTPPSNGSDSTFAAANDGYVPAQQAAPAPAAPSDSYPAPLVANNRHTSLLPVPDIAPIAPPAASKPSQGQPMRAPLNVARQPAAPVLTPPSSKKNFASAIADFFGGSRGMSSSESGQWGNKFLEQTRTLAGHGIGYDHSWRPDGEARNWEMDCSNTTRYLYQVTAGISLPRTASDQYYYLHLQDKAWDAPMTTAGFADCNFLRSNLKPGDLLFWENTYRPERQPPITHVMIFLGTDARGRWLMAGSQGSRGFYNPHHSGPDVYIFDPTHAVGGYTTWLGLVRHHGRFVAYGRPLEADAKKLSVASSE